MASCPPTPGLPPARQRALSLGLAALIVLAWAATLGWALWRRPSGWAMPAWGPLLVAWIAWLDVGLFIVGHDAMHGSLAPGWPAVNRAVGGLCLRLYGGFSMRRFEHHHAGHHRWPGTAEDPDFHADGRRFWPWYGAFMRRYTGWREAAGLGAIFVLLTAVLQAPAVAVLFFWALPALLSSVQLFCFGTWLPHRRGHDAFADGHRARGSRLPAWLSLLCCYHFGHHHAHHRRTGAPWWRLPALSREVAPTAPRAAARPAEAATGSPPP